jgi:hypothetical protein
MSVNQMVPVFGCPIFKCLVFNCSMYLLTRAGRRSENQDDIIYEAPFYTQLELYYWTSDNHASHNQCNTRLGNFMIKIILLKIAR